MLSVGEILRKEREKKGLSLVQVEKEIRVRQKFLVAIEENDWNGFTSKIYITGVITNYARFLGLDPQKMVAFFRRDYEKIDDVKFKKNLSRGYLNPETKKYAFGGIAILVLLFVLYFGYQLTLYLAPPSVTLLSPKQDIFRSTEKITITGKTEKDATATVMGDRLYINKDGIFQYDLPLRKGRNTFKVDVTGANGKKSSLQKTYILE